MINQAPDREDNYWRYRFQAMACPCEVLVEADSEFLARTVAGAVETECRRIEQKYSRYRDDNIVYALNHSAQEAVSLDSETAGMLEFADKLYQLSEGLFDVTSGVLREVWQFDGSDNIPSSEQVDKILQRIGWPRLQRQANTVSLPEGMELDLGGIGKEYAVDRCVQVASELCADSVLINFGGDLAMTRPRNDDAFWAVGRLVTGREEAAGFFEFYQGAIATSGDANRYLLKDGIRYGHILNPKTGWPVQGGPHTISVAAPTCLQAGMMSTLAMLQGAEAEAFLKAQEVDYWID